MTNLYTGKYSGEVAKAVREVAAAHIEAGAPNITEVDNAWFDLLAHLAKAEANDDRTLAIVAVEHYIGRCLDAIKKAAKP